MKDKTNWIGGEDELLKGFPLDQRKSNPIEFWSDIFLHTNDTGHEIAILFMVSRGLFNQLTYPNDLKVFLLPSFISSIQIFNLERVSQHEIKFLVVN